MLCAITCKVSPFFIIKTDHISLKYLLEQRLHHTLQHKGLCKLLGLEYTIQYKKGVYNKVADALSRRVNMETGESHHISVLIPNWIEDLRQSYEGDELAKQVIDQFNKGDKLKEGFSVAQGIVRRNEKLYVGPAHNWRNKI